jgi:hypothetical protein
MGSGEIGLHFSNHFEIITNKKAHLNLNSDKSLISVYKPAAAQLRELIDINST